MKKLTLFFLSLLVCGLAFQACDNTKTYAEMLEEEKEAIKAFIKDNNIKVISQNRIGSGYTGNRMVPFIGMSK